jgi:hypothetical protein
MIGATCQLSEITLMTAFNTSQLPASVTTVERLLVWATLVLHDLYPDETVIEYPGQLDRVIQSTPLFITASQPATWRHIGRTSVPMAKELTRGNKLWTYVQEIGTLPVPGEYQS